MTVAEVLVIEKTNFSFSFKVFFENLLLNANHELKNRYMHVDYKAQSAIQSANYIDSKCQNGTLELSLEELAIINIIKSNPVVTQMQINGKRNGRWKVLVEI